ncbi:MAG: HD domain-containing phosphohydrolase [Bacillota bacterium]
MKIKHSLTFSLIALLSVFTVALLYLGYSFWLQDYIEREKSENREKITRLQAAFEQEQNVLATLCNDWGFWDEAYKFVGGSNPDFAAQYGQANSLSLSKIGVDYMAIFDISGKKLLSTVADIKTDSQLDESKKIGESLSETGTLFAMVKNSKEGVVKGAISRAKGSLLVAVAPILPGNGTGSPSGYVLFAKKINKQFLDELLKKGYVSDVWLDFVNTAPPWLKPDKDQGPILKYYADPAAENQSGCFVIHTEENHNLFISAVIKKTNDGYTTLIQFALYVLICLLIAVLLFILITRRVLFRKFKLIESYLREYDAQKQHNGRKHLQMDSDDELSDLANALNKTIDEVETLYSDLLTELEERKRNVAQLRNTQIGTIVSLAKLAEYRDTDTGEHLTRVTATCKILATCAATRPEFAGLIDDAFIEELEIAATLHDIGKVGISDAILRKCGPYTQDEYTIMKSHTVYGSITLQQMLEKHPDNEFIKMAEEIARYHHERWNGEGYPEQLSGTDIPLSARIVAVADVFDALMSERCYKPAYSMEKSRKIIVKSAGIQFDPVLVDVFCDCFTEIVKQYI